jgi:acyl-CoA synthetase (NDP forming)
MASSAATIISDVKARQRTLLTEVEAKALLGDAGIPVAKTRLVQTRKEAVAHAKALGFPIVLKVCSPDVIHKSDSGGVKLNLTTAAAVQHGFGEIEQAVLNSHPSAIMDGVSVQPMARPGVEVIVGLLCVAHHSTVWQTLLRPSPLFFRPSANHKIR